MLLLATLAVCGGCDDGVPFDYIPVTGQITYEDGTPIPASGMKLQFEPLDAQVVNGMHPRIATADVNAEGKFTSATSYKHGDGLVPGRHRVSIGYATDKEGKLLIPKKNASLASSDLIVDTETLPLEIKVSKP